MTETGSTLFRWSLYRCLSQTGRVRGQYESPGSHLARVSLLVLACGVCLSVCLGVGMLIYTQVYLPGSARVEVRGQRGTLPQLMRVSPFAGSFMGEAGLGFRAPGSWPQLCALDCSISRTLCWKGELVPLARKSLLCRRLVGGGVRGGVGEN